jgi:hypothetical protein
LGPESPSAYCWSQNRNVAGDEALTVPASIRPNTNAQQLSATVVTVEVWDVPLATVVPLALASISDVWFTPE